MIFDGNGIGCYKTPSLDSGTTKILGTQKQDQSIIFFGGGGGRGGFLFCFLQIKKLNFLRHLKKTSWCPF